jgi:acetyl-CoA acetyltransferase
MADMATHAIDAALEDAGIEWLDVDAMVAGAYLWNADHEGLGALLQGASIAAAMGFSGIPVVNCTNASATGQTLLREAYLTVASGQHDIVVAVASDKSAGGMFTPLSSDEGYDEDFIRFVMTGVINPAYWAMECTRRMHDLGTTEEDLAMVKVLTSQAAPLNPLARYQRTYTVEEVLGSRIIGDPLRLLEVCATSDGAAAVILASEAVTRRCRKDPVWIDAIALASRTFGDPSIRTPTMGTVVDESVPGLSEAHNCMRALRRGMANPRHPFDVIELPDNSSWHYLTYVDIVLGLAPGSSESLLRESRTHPIKGPIPICPSGGSGATGEAVLAQGLLQVHEVVTQLRGEAGARQVETDVEVGLAMSYGYLGNNAGCVLTTGY